MVGYCLAHLFEEDSYLARVELKNSQSSLNPSQGYRRLDDTYCWICGAPIVDVHCKIVCKRCGFMRDCSDP